MKNRILLTLCAALFSMSAFGWGQKGHDVVAFIAEQHLTPATRAAVDSLFDGRSMVYWANWLDNASYSKPYAYTKTWHYKNIDADRTYYDMPANPAGDAVTAIKSRVEMLESPQTSMPDRVLALKILVHVMGDLHQPMHMGHATDLGGNRIKLKYFGRDANLHGIWDTSLVESAHKWSFTEWQQQLDRLSPEAESVEISGTVDDWARQSADIASEIYVYFQPGTRVSYDQVARWTPVIEQQLLRGGLRLAHTLNSIFDPSYAQAANNN